MITLIVSEVQARSQEGTLSKQEHRHVEDTSSSRAFEAQLQQAKTTIPAGGYMSAAPKTYQQALVKWHRCFISLPNANKSSRIVQKTPPRVQRPDCMKLGQNSVPSRGSRTVSVMTAKEARLQCFRMVE